MIYPKFQKIPACVRQTKTQTKEQIKTYPSKTLTKIFAARGRPSPLVAARRRPWPPVAARGRPSLQIECCDFQGGGDAVDFHVFVPKRYSTRNAESAARQTGKY